MANLLESSQTQATTAPSFYNQYLSNLATTGSQAAGLGQPVQTAKYVGAQPLQQQAFQQVAGAGSSYVPQLTQASQTLGQAAGAVSPLEAGAQYLSQAAGYNPAEMASQFMSPYARTAAQGLSDIAERNIQQNVSPNATAAAVGSGQYGSMRGAQVLGQLQANERQNLNSQIAQMMNQGYGQALQAATAQNQMLGQLGSTAGQQAAQGQQNLGAIGQQMGALAGTQQNLGLGAVNALSTLGEQQRQIEQQEELFPLTRLAQLSNIMQGYQIPTTTETKLNMSPLSALGTIGAGTAGLFTQKLDSFGNPIKGTSLFDQIKGQFNTPTPTGPGLPTRPVLDNELEPPELPPMINPTLPDEFELPYPNLPTPTLPDEFELPYHNWTTVDPNLYNPVEPPYDPGYK